MDGSMPSGDRKQTTVKAEMAAGRQHTPDFAWPTVSLALGCLAAFAAATALAVTGAVPYWLAAVVNTAVIYAIYTPVHEAVHANISSRHQNRRWVDVALGIACCVPLWLFFHEHRKQHMLHHARTNYDDDPDIYMRAGFVKWLLVNLPWALINYFNPVELYRRCRAFNVPAGETRITMATFAVQMAVLIGLLAAGFWLEVLVLWFVPWWIGQTVMLTLFGWVPHHDFSETGRYRNTRVSLVPFGDNALFLGQNLHLIHHMMPSIPWYRYRAVFDDIRPLLEQNHVRIEGLWPPHGWRAIPEQPAAAA